MNKRHDKSQQTSSPVGPAPPYKPLKTTHPGINPRVYLFLSYRPDNRSKQIPAPCSKPRSKLMKIPRPAGQRYRAGPVSLVRRSGHTRIQGFLVLRLHRQPTSGGIPRTAAGLASASESCLRRRSPGRSPSRKSIPPSVVEAISGSCGRQKKVRSYDLTLKRRLPTLPRENRSTIGVSELNFSVRNGKRWNLTAITT